MMKCCWLNICAAMAFATIPVESFVPTKPQAARLAVRSSPSASLSRSFSSANADALDASQARPADPPENDPTAATTSTTPSSSLQYTVADAEAESSAAAADPLKYSFDHLRSLDFNALLNTAILATIGIAVLAKLTLIDSHMTRGWTAEETAFRTVTDNWLSYSSILDQAPMQTKAVTSAVVYSIGDLIAQRTEGKELGDLDRPRVVRSLLAGLIGHGPLSHLWYDISEGFFTNVGWTTQWWSVFPKVAIDQLMWGPFWNNCYIVLLGLMKTESLESIWSDMKRTTVPLVVSGLKLWPLAHCVTYGLIPVENRLLWVDVVEILWVTILATQAAGGGEHISSADDESDRVDPAQEARPVSVTPS